MMPSMNMDPTGLAGVDSSSPMMDKPYFIDRIEDGIATVYVQSDGGEQQQQIDVAELPEGAKEGDTVNPDGTIQSGDGGETQMLQNRVRNNAARGLGADDGMNIRL